jgi:hypothetical protein
MVEARKGWEKKKTGFRRTRIDDRIAWGKGFEDRIDLKAQQGVSTDPRVFQQLHVPLIELQDNSKDTEQF